MQQDCCQRTKFKKFGKSSFSDQKESKGCFHRGNIQEKVESGFLRRQIGHSRSERKIKFWFDYFLGRQEIFKLNEQNNKNRFWSLWIGIVPQKQYHNIANQQISSAKNTEAREKQISKNPTVL